MNKHAYILAAFLLAPACNNRPGDPGGDPEAPAGTTKEALKVEDKGGTPAANCKNGHDEEESGSEVVTVSAEGAPTRGPRNAPVEIVFWSDFECPFCERAEATLKQVEAERPGKVKIAFRQRPLPFHDHAALAAKASLAADRQGKFWPYHDLLVANRNALEKADLVRYANEAGLDRFRFEHDLADPSLDTKIAEESARGDALGVRGTPTAFINGRRLTGAQPLKMWLALVDR